jgi:hypothetical protein
MLIFAPSTHKQHFDSSIQNTIRDRNNAASSGDIAYLSNSAMNAQRLTQNTRPDYIGKNRSAQLTADNDEYRTAASLACSSQSIATIGSHNISHLNNLYTQQVPPQNHQHPTPSPSTSSQPFSLPGDICKIILHAAKNKEAGINADTINLFTTLIKFSIPTIKPDLHFIFDLIYQNKLPQCIKRYFTDVYLFCLHKDPKDTTKFRPLGIPTAIQRLIASHVAHTLRDKFSSHLLPIQLCSQCTQRKQLFGEGNATLNRKFYRLPPTYQQTPHTRSRLLQANKPIQQCLLRRILQCHQNLLSQTPPPH